jgi:hypothetical protein
MDIQSRVQELEHGPTGEVSLYNVNDSKNMFQYFFVTSFKYSTFKNRE